MSKPSLFFFISLFFLLNFCLDGVAQSSADAIANSLLKEANTNFDKEFYPEAARLYEAVYDRGYFTEKMLYQLAMAHEQNQQPAKAIYCLRKIHYEYGGDQVETKISQIREQMGWRSLIVGESLSEYYRFIQSNQMLLWASLIIFLLLGGGFLLGNHDRLRLGMGLSASFIALLLGGILLQYQLRPQKAVIIAPTSFYSQAGYATPQLSLPLSPGATVTIEDQNDLWLQVSAGPVSCWIPHFVLKKI